MSCDGDTLCYLPVMFYVMTGYVGMIDLSWEMSVKVSTNAVAHVIIIDMEYL